MSLVIVIIVKFYYCGYYTIIFAIMNIIIPSLSPVITKG